VASSQVPRAWIAEKNNLPARQVHLDLGQRSDDRSGTTDLGSQQGLRQVRRLRGRTI